jgi:tetratricopeptide (TPR) repeat protein
MTVDRSGVQDQDPSGRNGFLNTNNPALQETVKRQFYQIWGERPLADNWRVQSLMRTQIVDDQVSEIDEGTEQTILLDVEIDLSEVPFTQNEQDSVRRRISALQYELGNLMYLSMDMPDSAAYYFRKAIENPSEDRINMVSLYSLSELYESAGNAERSLEYANRLLREYPNSSFARELRGENRDAGESNETERLIAAFNTIMQSDSLSITIKADSLRSLSLSFSDQPRSDLILYESIQLYLKAGSEDSLYSERITAWQNYKDHSNFDSALVDRNLSDSLFMALPDSLNSKNGRSVRSDSLNLMKDPLRLFPYQSEAFDSARNTISIFLDTYPSSSLIDKVKTIQDEITLADIVKDTSEQQEPDNEANVLPDQVEEEGYVSCEKIERELNFRSGRNEILLLISKTQNMDTLSIRFRVNHRGLVDSYVLLTDEVSKETSEELDRIINNIVVFDPTIYQARSVPVACTITISGDQ